MAKARTKAAKAVMKWVKLENRGSLVDSGTQYRNLQAWQSNCTLCGIEFIEHTPGRSPPDQPPTVTTCDEHRGAPICVNYGWAAWDGKNVVPGPRMKIGAAGMRPGDTAPSEELAELKAELKASYEVSLDHMQEKGDAIRALAALRVDYDKAMAKLAEYELQSAMAKEAAKNNFPWGQNNR